MPSTARQMLFELSKERQDPVVARAPEEIHSLDGGQPLPESLEGRPGSPHTLLVGASALPEPWERTLDLARERGVRLLPRSPEFPDELVV
jgi:hypothetical protein